MMINRDLLDWQNRWTKCKEGKTGKDRQTKQTRGRRSPNDAQQLPSFEVHVMALKSDWVGRRCRMCVCVCVSVWTFHVTSAARWEGFAVRLHQSLLCPHRPMLGTVPRYQHARVPKPCCLFSPSFFLCLLFPSLPPPDTLLFSLLPPHAFLLFPVCYSSSFLTSRLPPLCHCFSLRSVVQHVSPVRRTWRLMLVPLKRFGGLNLFQVFLKEWSGWGTGSDMTAQQESLFGLVSDEDTFIQPRDYTHTHTPTLFVSEHMGFSQSPPPTFPLSAALTFGPSVQWKAFWWTACADTVNWCHVWFHF